MKERRLVMAETKEPITHEIEKHIGVLSVNDQTGWQKEVNLVSWNDRPAKVDLRDWSPDHSKLGRGITLTDEEAKALGRVLEEHFS